MNRLTRLCFKETNVLNKCLNVALMMSCHANHIGILRDNLVKRFVAVQFFSFQACSLQMSK